MSKPSNIYSIVEPKSKEQIDIEIQKGFDDLKAGRVISAKQVREEMQGLYLNHVRKP